MSSPYRRSRTALPVPWRAAEAVCYICCAHATCIVLQNEHNVTAYCMWCLATQLELLTGYRILNVVAQFQANRKAGADATGKQLKMEIGTDGY